MLRDDVPVERCRTLANQLRSTIEGSGRVKITSMSGLGMHLAGGMEQSTVVEKCNEWGRQNAVWMGERGASSPQ